MFPGITLPLALLALGQVPADPSRIESGGDLQAAIARAAPGDTLLIAAGMYAGPLLVDRVLVLLGQPGAVIDAGARGDAVRVTADSVTVRGFTIRGSGRSLTDDEAAIKLVGCTACVIAENRIEHSLHGIYLLESHDVELSGNVIEGDPSLVEARRGNGIHLFHSSGNRLLRNTIRRTRDGIYFSFASGNVVESNDVAHVRYGLHYMYSDDNAFHANRFTRNAAGAAIMFSRRILFERNVFAEHVGYRAYGILLQTAYEVEARENRIVGNLVGVFLDMSENNTFRGNAIVGNGTGIDLIPSAENNMFAGNVIASNRVAVRIAVGGGRNDWAEAGRGNYWGDRAIYDLDGDGVGDRPFRVGDPFASLAAVRPVLEIFTGTPAALALSWAEQAFPVFDLPRAEDPSPLTRMPAGVPAADLAIDSPRAASGVSAAALALLFLPVVWRIGRARARKSRRASDG
jgi:nitrous oxidase accessory protein